MKDKVFALIDCNSFYCSCERIFRPDLNNRPVIVLSNNDGCAIARTNEAKALGIAMGAPYFKIKNLCKQKGVAVFSSNFSLYTNISDRVMKTLINTCPEVEVYSVDEAFVDLTGVKELDNFGHFLKGKILKEIGIPVGVGIAPTKVLAKIANHIAKKSNKAQGVVNLVDPRLRDIALKRVLVADIWGIGQASSRKLNSLGIYTAYEFKEYPNESLIQKHFTKVGLQIKQELMGINCFSLGQSVEHKKEIMCSRSFGQAVVAKEDLSQAISHYISNAAEKMRRQESLCTQISVFARTNAFAAKEQFYLYGRKSLVNPTSDTRKLLEVGLKILDENYRKGVIYAKAGVSLSDFYQTGEYQIDFLAQQDSLRDEKLMRVVDKINYQEGPGSIQFASCGTSEHAWKMKRSFKSPRYTTSWTELMRFS